MRPTVGILASPRALLRNLQSDPFLNLESDIAMAFRHGHLMYLEKFGDPLTVKSTYFVYHDNIQTTTPPASMQYYTLYTHSRIHHTKPLSLLTLRPRPRP